MISVLRNPQLANTLPITRAKSKELTVETISQHECWVNGIHDTYLVRFSNLTCSCPAGTARLHCSHVQTGLRELARMQGFAFTTFFRDEQRAHAFAGMQEALGRVAVPHCEHGWFYVTHGASASTPPPRGRYTAGDLYGD